MVSLTGTDDQALLLQLHTAIELFMSEKVLQHHAPTQDWFSHPKKELGIKNAFTLGSSPDILSIESICRVLQINIQTLYLDTTLLNEGASKATKELTTLGKSLNSPVKDTVKVMFTGEGPFGFYNKSWDGFYPLVPLIRREGDHFEVHTNDGDESHLTTANDQKGVDNGDLNLGTVPDDQDCPNDGGIFEPAESDDDFVGYCTDDYDVEENNENEKEEEERSKESEAKSSPESSPLTSPEKNAKSPKKSKQIKKKLLLQNSRVVDNLVKESVQVQFLEKDEFKTGDEDLDEAIEQRTNPVFKYLELNQVIPVTLLVNKKPQKKGPKGNTRRVIDNSYNDKQNKKRKIMRAQGMKPAKILKVKNYYGCDRGAYGERRTHDRVFLRMSGKEFSYERDISYVKGVFKIGKKVMKEQPDLNDVIIVRTTVFPSVSGNFEKKCTEFTQVPEDMKDLETKMLVEFNGDDTNCDRPHGNSRTLKRTYKYRSK